MAEQSPAPPSLPFLRTLSQVCFVVDDIDSALDFWAKALRVGPFIVMEDALGDRPFIHRGQVSNVKISLALGYLGDTQIEIIAQTNTAPSPYREFLAKGGKGLQHLAFLTEDFDSASQELKLAGFEETSWIESTDGSKNASYFSGPDQFGSMVELSPMTPTRRMYYAAIKALQPSRNNGPLVHRFKTRADFLASDICSAVGER